MLRDPALADTVVIVNEFGEIGLDHLLIETVDEDMILLGAGCLCCTVRGDLIATLEDLLRKRDNGRIHAVPPGRDRDHGPRRPRADPARADLPSLSRDAVPAAGRRHRGRRRQRRRDPRRPSRRPCARRRWPTGSWSPRRISPPMTAAALRRGSATSTRGADRSTAPTCAAPSLSRRPVRPRRQERRRARLARRRGAWTRDHHHGHHHHDVNRHDAAIRAFCLTSDAPVPRAAFEMFLDLLRSAHGPKLLRLKGLVALADAPDRPVVVHGVQHVIHAPVHLAAWPDDDRRSRLVLIVRDLDPAFVDQPLGRLPRPAAHRCARCGGADDQSARDPRRLTRSRRRPSPQFGAAPILKSLGCRRAPRGAPVSRNGTAAGSGSAA